MKMDRVRTTIDIPAPSDRKLKEQAAVQVSSARPVQFPLIRSEGPPVAVTSEQIYERVDFP